jgi:hypothetical protein
MWEIIIATITGTGIGLSVHIFHSWYKTYVLRKNKKRQELIESIVLGYLKQLQTNEHTNGKTKSTKKT